MDELRQELERNSDHYEVALAVFTSIAEEAEYNGDSPVVACSAVAGVLVSEYDMDENEVADALEDTLFMGAG